MDGLLKDYDLGKLTVATIASHSAFQILLGAKREGLRTLALAPPGRGWFYSRAWFVDEVWELDLRDLTSMADRLLSRSAVLVPHGSYVEYVGWRAALEIRVPTFGNRYLLEWEADQHRKMDLLASAGLHVPRTYGSPDEVDGPVIVKLYGAKGGRGYFFARDADELREGLREVDGPYIIQEYVVGVPAYHHFFYSPLMGRVELFGFDVRYESNVDGRTFGLAEPTFVVVGNTPLVLRESLLPGVQRDGESFTSAVSERTGRPPIGPFSLESIVRDTLEVVYFEFSGRIVAGTSVYMVHGSPYSLMYFKEPLDMGRRIAMEIREAAESGRLQEIVT
ncbi:formate--phosphoribosylaminoimidazolecarboxamide ligase [Conexivisphaera calida]|uniref:formate--phosphoribosylaminoimidazolecarboxamide ligase n=1 Tax=Conexivisphaera calida TaxID=1874277 RepID=UPI00157A78D4